MATDFFPQLILGHFIGDFLLQNKWMAMNKSASNWKCAVHCALYTLAVTATTYPTIFSFQWSIFVFLTHFPVDRWSWADKWLDLINGRSLRDFIISGKHGIPKEYDFENYHCLRGGFTSVVYTVADNTIHLILMWYGYKLLF